MSLKIYVLKLDFDKNVDFRKFGVAYGTSNIEKPIPRSKIKKNMSTNHFPDTFCSQMKWKTHKKNDNSGGGIFNTVSTKNSF